MMPKWYKGFNHTITIPEFDYMANRLHGMEPTDIHKFMDHAFTNRETEFYESESRKLVAHFYGQKYVACANDDPKAVKLSRKELGKREHVLESVTAKFLFNMLSNTKPNMSAEVTKRTEDNEKSLGKLCYK
jgi:hypothetical protein